VVKRIPPTPKESKKQYQVTDRERTALRKQLGRINAAPAAPRVKVDGNEETPKIALDHPDERTATTLLMEALGTTDIDFAQTLLSQAANVGSQGQKLDETGINFIISVIKDIRPRDQLEAMLAAQMAAMHLATMTFAGRLAYVENIPQQDSAGNQLNKLARTFATQMETLKRYRTGGEQKVTVQHVSVSEGGQAIVGNVTQSPAESRSKPPTAATPPALTHDKTIPMPPVEAKGSPAKIGIKRKAK